MVDGVLVEPLGESWVVYSPASGETHLVNDTTAAMLESVSGEWPLTSRQLAQLLAADAGVVRHDAELLVQQAVSMMVTAGLFREVPLPHADPQ